MSKNKDFFNRISIIDECLRRRGKKWYVEELLNCVNDRLLKDYGKSVSSRTLYDDLKYLQNEKDAPIEKLRDGNRVQIRYADVNFSIKNIPLYDEDLVKLRDALTILRQVAAASLVDEVENIVARLENTFSSGLLPQKTIVQFEQHTASSGAEYFDDLFTAIKEKLPLEIKYQPFGRAEPYFWIIHPYLLKEYRNRWFLLARLHEESRIVTIALDRIQGKVKASKVFYIQNDLFDAESFFKNVIGVTLPEGETISEIYIKVKPNQAPYIKTKPIHFNQEVVQRDEDGSIRIKLKLVNNYELRSVLLSYGADIEVLEPVNLREQVKSVFRLGYELYL
jgi:predicted DNA-binding transcriptional regulator YafY